MRNVISSVVGLVAALCLGVGYVESTRGQASSLILIAAGGVLTLCAFAVRDRGRTAP